MHWQEARQRFSTPPFDALREPLGQLITEPAMPGIARLNEIAVGIKNFRGQPIRFVANEDATNAHITKPASLNPVKPGMTTPGAPALASMP